MRADETRPSAAPAAGPTVAVAATFTAEPILRPLDFWMREAGLAGPIEFAPYGQVFQELLDPGSLLGRNRGGVNAVLLRVEDWLRYGPSAGDPEAARSLLDRNAGDLVAAVEGAATRGGAAPMVLALCPPSPAALEDPERRALLEAAERRIAGALGGVAGVAVLGPEDLAAYPVAESHDPGRDALGHIPYTPAFFAALAAALARRIHALKAPPYKVIVLDCDNTLWQGVVGEEGTLGVAVPPWCRALQEFVLRQIDKGFVACLCSKNEERDALEVLERHPDMVLRRDHLVGWRINWEPKSENLRALAAELNVGLDSFVFLDDNPVECAEVRARCPEVLTIQVPPADEVGPFLDHLWAFDRLKVTSEDRQRTAMYRENAERARLQERAGSFGDFLSALELRVDIHEPTAEQWGRVSQLTQRTNQFNFTTVRRSEAEARGLAAEGLECRAVEVRDRFGDYGLVGVLIYGRGGDAIEVDTFLLSCRVLGRGVEHRMLNHLGEAARGLGLAAVVATAVPTAKNLPARRFLDKVAAGWKEERDGRSTYRIPAESAAAAAPDASGEAEGGASAAEAPAASPSGTARAVAAYERIALHLRSPERVVEELERLGPARRDRPDLGAPPTPPSSEAERRLCEAWAELLGLGEVGIHDDYFELGGTSLLAVDLLARVERLTGVRLPLTAIVEAPTVAGLARLLEQDGPRDSLVTIRAGGDRPAVFLVHDGDGETMLYRNLALRLDPGHAVYGLQPHGLPGYPMLHTRIEDMAEHHVEKILSAQPSGPYLVGGMCAGGVIAYEVARRLQARGEAVALVALLDAADPEAQLRPFRSANQRLRGLSGALGQGEGLGPVRRAAAIGSKVARKARNFVAYEARRRADGAWTRLRMRLFRRYTDRGIRPPGYLSGISVRKVYLHAESSYRPPGKFDGDLALFRATQGVGDDEPYCDRYSDPLLGWGGRATGCVRAYDVPGGHSSMLQEPNVRVLAETMQAAIDEALASRAPGPMPAMAGVP
ncbi:HAD-IIIC family phosphatase [Aquisphaera giovannonii]|nr:HAD-IIIC family phosphatase [Aquisphaera giovannonii]